ncbi:MAG: phosphoglucomutase/phosphomannomutase family protein [Halobacteriales archaeon]|nr:phosphoglucomutase/phosphomannomutase family protein [Halobacteriales archaeon]
MDDVDAIAFGTDGWRATLETFTTPRVRMVGQAVATYLDEQAKSGAVMIGYDARESSRGFAEELARVLAANGRDVLLPERDRPTPLIAWTVVDRELAGALMVTASHNPPEYNGVKFIPADGAPALPAVTEAIEQQLAAPDPKPESTWGTIREIDVVAPHAQQARDLIGTDLTGVTVVYDAMHGSGRGVTDALLESAGATVIRRRCSRDPTFGGTPPEPSPEHLTGLVDAVREHDADVGLANDGDADRIAVVTPERGCLDGNRLFAAMYDYLLETATGPAIRTVSTTFLIDRIAEAHGEAVHETPVGFKWVADAMAEHDALIGGEESGGYSIRGHVREKDGVLMALLAAAAAVDQPLDDRLDALLAAHGEIHQDKRSVDCPDAEKQRVITALGEELPTTVAGEPVEEVNDADGFKILLADGSWLLIRPSGTEPVLRVYAEAGSHERVDELLTAGEALVEPLV